MVLNAMPVQSVCCWVNLTLDLHIEPIDDVFSEGAALADLLGLDGVVGVGSSVFADQLLELLLGFLSGCSVGFLADRLAGVGAVSDRALPAPQRFVDLVDAAGAFAAAALSPLAAHSVLLEMRRGPQGAAPVSYR